MKAGQYTYHHVTTSISKTVEAQLIMLGASPDDSSHTLCSTLLCVCHKDEGVMAGSTAKPASSVRTQPPTTNPVNRTRATAATSACKAHITTCQCAVHCCVCLLHCTVRHTETAFSAGSNHPPGQHRRYC